MSCVISYYRFSRDRRQIEKYSCRKLMEAHHESFLVILSKLQKQLFSRISLAPSVLAVQIIFLYRLLFSLGTSSIWKTLFGFASLSPFILIYGSLPDLLIQFEILVVNGIHCQFLIAVTLIRRHIQCVKLNVNKILNV